MSLKTFALIGTTVTMGGILFANTNKETLSNLIDSWMNPQENAWAHRRHVIDSEMERKKARKAIWTLLTERENGWSTIRKTQVILPTVDFEMQHLDNCAYESMIKDYNEALTNPLLPKAHGEVIPNEKYLRRKEVQKRALMEKHRAEQDAIYAKSLKEGTITAVIRN